MIKKVNILLTHFPFELPINGPKIIKSKTRWLYNNHNQLCVQYQNKHRHDYIESAHEKKNNETIMQCQTKHKLNKYNGKRNGIHTIGMSHVIVTQMSQYKCD